MERSDSLILAAVIADLRQRESKGLETYGTTMDRTDLSHEEWLNHLYEEVLDSAVYLKKVINGTQGITNHKKENNGIIEGIASGGEVGNTGTTLREVPETKPDGGGEGGGELEDDEEYSEGEDRLLICAQQIEAAVNALYTIESRDEMLLGNDDRRTIREIDTMAMHITYRALSEIYQSVFSPQ